MLLTACGDNDGTGGFDASKTIKLQKLELGNAKYLSLSGPSSRAHSEAATEVGLFKIDEHGNVSTVVLSCVETDDGAVTHVREDIQVIPRHLISLVGVYTLMSDCEFKTAEGDLINMLSYYEPGSYGAFNILVRNSDGRIFYIPQSAGKYFANPKIQSTTLDHDGNLYLLPSVEGNDDLLELTLQNDNLVIKQVNPNNIGVTGDQIWPLDNGTIVVSSWGDYYTFLYPNGGFEQNSLFDKEHIFLSQTADGIKAVRLEVRNGTPQREYIVSLHDYTVGTSAGGNVLSQPIASISSGTEYSTNLGDANYIDWVSKASMNHDWIRAVYETVDSYLLGQCLVVDKQTKRITPLNWEQSNRLIFPREDNTYKGLAWSTSSEDASWCNIETLEYGVVYFDLSQAGAFQQTGSFSDIPSGKVTITGVRNSDGKQVICIVDIETGHAVCSVNDSNRPITVLVPLN